MTTTPTFQRSPKFYFAGGDVCLLSSDNVLFRLLKAQLASQSETFTDLFDLSSSEPKESEGYEGTPIIQLTDSTAELENVFTILWLPP